MNSKIDKSLLFKIFIIACLYSILGRLGFLLAIPPGNVSPIWLPAGVALLSMIYYGTKVWPGVFLGSVLINSLFYVEFSITKHYSEVLLPSCLISIGSVLQAFITFFLYKKFIGLKEKLKTSRQIIIFTFTVAMVGSFVSPTWGTSTLLLNHAITFHKAWLTWITWWCGDTSGVILLCIPILLTKFQNRGDFRNETLSLKTVITTIVIMVVTLIASWIIVSYVQNLNKILIGISHWGPNPDYGKNINAFKSSLTQSGYIEGKNIEYIIRSPNTKKENVRPIIEEFLQLKVDLIFTQSTPGTIPAKELTSTVPIVFSIVTFPVENGLIHSLENSANNLVGTRNYIPLERQIQVFKKLVRNFKSLAFVHRKDEPNSTFQLREMEMAAKSHFFKVIEIAAKDNDEILKLLEEKKNEFDVVYSACDTLIQSGGENSVIDFVKKYKLPDFACLGSGVTKGSLVGNIADFSIIGGRAGEIAAKILKGAKPQSLSTESPEQDTILINLKRAEELNIVVDPTLLEMATEVIR